MYQYGNQIVTLVNFQINTLKLCIQNYQKIIYKIS